MRSVGAWLAIANIGERNYLTYTFPVRTGAVFTGETNLSTTVDGIVYSLSGSHDLVNFNRGVVEVVPPLESSLPAPNAGWSYRTFRLAGSVAEMPSGFIRFLVGTAGP